MKLSVSNIAWPAECDLAAYRLLARFGIEGVEVAPTRFWPHWEGITAPSIRERKREIQLEGLRVSSLQSILFHKPELLLFGSAEQRASLVRHLSECADLAAELGAESMVFGAPKNRLRGALKEDEAERIAAELFAAAGEECAKRDVCLVLEANPEAYGCDFVTRSEAAERIVRKAASAGFRLHLDSACMHLAGEDSRQAIARTVDVLRHFHASEPHLGSFCQPKLPHREIAAQLAGQGYKGWVALEMRAADAPLEALECAVRFFSEAYHGGD